MNRYLRIQNFLKVAGESERAKAVNLNKSFVFQNNLVPREEINQFVESGDERLPYSKKELEDIQAIQIPKNSIKRTSNVEKQFLIIGAVIYNGLQAENNLEKINQFLEGEEKQANFLKSSFNIDEALLLNKQNLKDAFSKLLSLADEYIEKTKELSNKSKNDEYQTNNVVYSFLDGWRVVYLPAVGDQDCRPWEGDTNTSHDRVLEGNKNGLCLGSGSKYYQTNDRGKLYSIRDPENKPRVTIRIQDNSLKEAKGKNNLPPDIDAAIKSNEWFESIQGLNYKNSYDFKSFPPLSIEIAREKFLDYPILAYDQGWITHWYKKGINEIDLDIQNKIANNDSLLITSGMHKKYKELIQPVVEYWCNEYLNGNNNAEEVLFGSLYSPPNHEVFKIYRKLPEMQIAAERLSERCDKNENLYFVIGLQEITEFENFSEKPIMLYAEKEPYKFLNFSEKPWAKKYIDLAAKNLAEKDPYILLNGFSEKPWAKKYIDLAAKNLAEKDPYSFLNGFSEKPWAKNYIDLAAKNLAKKDPYSFLYEFSEKDWAKEEYIDFAAKNLAKEDPLGFIRDYSEKDWAKNYIDLAAKTYAEVSPYKFLKDYSEKDRFSEKDWAKNYIDLAAKKFAEEEPSIFLKYFSKEPWAKKYIDLAAKNCAEKKSYDFLSSFSEKDWAKNYIDLAAKKFAEKEPSYFLDNLLKKDWVKEEYIDLAAKAYIKIDPYEFLYSFSEKPWIKEEYIDFAAEIYAEEEPYSFLNNFSKKDWVKEESIDLAAKAHIKMDPHEFLEVFSEEPWAQKYIDLAKEKIKTASKIKILKNYLLKLGFKKEAEELLKIM